MGILRRALTETKRGLGLNSWTALSVALAGLSVVIIRRLFIPDTDPRVELESWIVESVAWFTAVVVMFVPHMIRSLVKVRRQDKSLKVQIAMATASADARDADLKAFLTNVLTDPCYGVERCYLFGSVTKQYPTGDVDIVIQFTTSEQGQLLAYHGRLREVERSFRDLYDSKLHVQRFLSSEATALQLFLDDTDGYEQII